MKVLVIASKHGFGADIKIGEQEYYYNKLPAGMGVVSDIFDAHGGQHHCQIALDAGGCVIDSYVNKWGETILRTVEVEVSKLINYCEKIRNSRTGREGMVITSTGEWVFPDDWNNLEN